MTSPSQEQLLLRIMELKKALKSTKETRPRKLRKAKKLPNGKCNFVFQF